MAILRMSQGQSSANGLIVLVTHYKFSHYTTSTLAFRSSAEMFLPAWAVRHLNYGQMWAYWLRAISKWQHNAVSKLSLVKYDPHQACDAHIFVSKQMQIDFDQRFLLLHRAKSAAIDSALKQARWNPPCLYLENTQRTALSPQLHAGLLYH